MGAISATRSVEQRGNAFGLLRLMLAGAVVWSHTPEIIDGDRHREPLVRIFGTISLGDLAVDGFFLVSGYLIAGSFLRCPRAWPYLRHRVARIYPAFLVASIVSLLLVAPLAGASGAEILASANRSLARMLTLQRPEMEGVFDGTAHATLNNPMWTIAYEFRCYLLLLLLGVTGMLRRRGFILLLAVASLTAFEMADASFWRQVNDALPRSLIWLGFLDHMLRFTGLFLAGTSFLLWRDRITFSHRGFLLSAIGLATCLFVPAIAEPGTALFGGYLLIGMATTCATGRASRINTRIDISYGLYLYAWPIAKLLLWRWPDLPMAAVSALTLTFAGLCGLLSWHLIEEPVLRRARQPARLADQTEPALASS